MRKKHLIENLHRAEARIKELEEIICPAHQHQWFEDYQEECYICTKSLPQRMAMCTWSAASTAF